MLIKKYKATRELRYNSRYSMYKTKTSTILILAETIKIIAKIW